MSFPIKPPLDPLVLSGVSSEEMDRALAAFLKGGTEYRERTDAQVRARVDELLRYRSPYALPRGTP